MSKENNWQEISKAKVESIITNELIKQAETFADNVKNKKLTLAEKIKYGVGNKLIKKAFKQLSDEYFKSAIITKGYKEFMKNLDQGKIIEFDTMNLKKENNKFYVEYKNII